MGINDPPNNPTLALPHPPRTSRITNNISSNLFGGASSFSFSCRVGSYPQKGGVTLSKDTVVSVHKKVDKVVIEVEQRTLSTNKTTSLYLPVSLRIQSSARRQPRPQLLPHSPVPLLSYRCCPLPYTRLLRLRDDLAHAIFRTG